MTLDRAVNQRCTCVNKRKKKRKQVFLMKEYKQVPAAVELVGAGRLEGGPVCRMRAVALSDPRLSNPSQDAEGELLWSIEEDGSIQQSVPVSTYHSYTIETSTYSKIKCEIYIFFIKKCVRSFIEVHHLRLIMVPLVFDGFVSLLNGI